jgi:prepilin-type N-terminal cleavage/methylation domain-containing protein
MKHPSQTTRSREAGFTLIETLVAIVILAFGLIAVTNLLIVAGTSNQVGHAATGTTAFARQQMDLLKATPYTAMTLGGSVDNDVTGFVRLDTLPGLGQIRTRWAVTGIAGDQQIRYIEVRSESMAPLLRARSRTDLRTFRACTATQIGCPTP